MQDVSDPSLLPTLQAFLYLFWENLGLELLVDLKSVLVDEAGLEVMLVGIPEQICKDLWLLRLAVEVQHVVHRMFSCQAGAAPLVGMILTTRRVVPDSTLCAEDRPASAEEALVRTTLEWKVLAHAELPIQILVFAW